ncbi:Fe-S cluster assembly protein SufD [Marinospirillum sp. MEB164]|uniref:Fe-S cluster assembly protein SufD n=1 Tax=Marinospirillum alkalitolerans TaxID=3123374 RepID=A0ABW8PVS3_9GAMM
MSHPVTADWAAQFAALNQAAPAGWLKSQRIAAFARFEHLGFPSALNEQWKYTDTRKIATTAYQLADQIDLAAAQALLDAQHWDLEAYRIVLVNGLFCAELSDLQDQPAGLVVEPLSHAFERELELTSGMMGRLAGIDIDSMTALNFAFAQEGAVIRVSQPVSKPIHLISLFTEQAAAQMSHTRVLVAVGPSSQVELIEHFISAPAAVHFSTRVAEVVLERNAQLKHVLVEQLGPQASLIGRVQAEQKRDSRYLCQHINLGGQLVRDDLVSDLIGEGAECHLAGLLFGRQRQHLDVHSLMNHNAPQTHSSENYKAILNDRAQGVFNGKVVVKRDSQKITAEQSNANLLLSDRAQINTKPELEIYADDVKCSHGATTGQLDLDALFYLRARGVDEEQARGLLTLAFANEVIDQIEHASLRHQVEELVAGHLPQRVEIETPQLESAHASASL